MSVDQEFVEMIVRTVVMYPDDVVVRRSVDEKGVLIELQVNPADLGRIIGGQGANINSIRNLLKMVGTKNNSYISLKVLE